MEGQMPKAINGIVDSLKNNRIAFERVRDFQQRLEPTCLEKSLASLIRHEKFAQAHQHTRHFAVRVRS